MVVPLNHLGIERRENNQYELLGAQREEAGLEGEVGTNSYYFSFPLQLCRPVEQGLASRPCSGCNELSEHCVFRIIVSSSLPRV